MSLILDVARMPNAIDGIHASVFRSDQTLALVRSWLYEGVPAKVVLELMAHIEELAREHESKGEVGGV